MAANMQLYMDQVLGINNVGMRNKLENAGFRNLASLVKKDTKFAHYACQSVRKSGTGQAASRDVTMEMEENLGRLVLYSRYRYIVQRPLDYASATLANLEVVDDWFNQLEDDPSEDTVPAFTDGANKKQWFENITAYLGIKKGKSGVPLLYVVREDPNLPPVDPGFGVPSFNDEVFLRGRHGGHFWAADNKSVWLLMRSKCHGTTAWNTIAGFQATNNGRAAFVALLGQFLGEDVRAVLLRRAERTLENIRFDGRNRNFSFDKFVGRLRESFLDLGPENQLTEQRKVNKLMQAFQVPSMQHLDSIIQAAPMYRNSFDNTVNFLANQLSQQKLKNGPTARNVGKLETIQEDDDGDIMAIDDAADAAKMKRNIKALKRKLKAAKAARIRGGGKDPKGPHKKIQASKFSKKNPSAYIPSSEWHKLSDEEKAAARAARVKKGIQPGQRNVGMLATLRRGVKWNDKVDYSQDGEVIEEVPIKPPARAGAQQEDEMVDDGDSQESETMDVDEVSVEDVSQQFRAKVNISAARVIPGVSATLLKAPSVKSLVTTQRASTYSKLKPPPAPGTTEGDKKPPPKKTKRSKKAGSKKRS